jgi:hypothetical protein
MPLVGTYEAQALPLRGKLVVVDPSLSGQEEDDFRECMADADEHAIGGSRWRLGIKPAQDTVEIIVRIEVWDTTADGETDANWSDPREIIVEFPNGQLIVENISAGPISLRPHGIEKLELLSGAGIYRITVRHRGRDTAAAAVQALWDADEVGDDIAEEYARLAGIEMYLLQIQPMQQR